MNVLIFRPKIIFWGGRKGYFFSFYRASAQLAMQMPCLSYGRGVRPSVCLSVCLPHSQILSKRGKPGSRNLHCQFREIL